MEPVAVGLGVWVDPGGFVWFQPLEGASKGMERPLTASVSVGCEGGDAVDPQSGLFGVIY